MSQKSGGWRPGKSEYVLLLLMFVFALQYLDRQIVVILAEPLKAEFGMSDSQVGLLSGLVFSIPYALMLIPVGYIVDRVSRRNLLAVAVTVWSLLTLLTGFARSLIEIMACRAMIAAAESTNNPAALSMLSDHYGKKNRATAIGIYYAGPAVATVLGFTLIGVIADWYGWRAAFLAAGVPGILLACLLVTTTREPIREDSQRTEKLVVAPPLSETLRFVRSQKSLCHMMLAMMLNSFVVASQIAWMSPLLMRAHNLSLVDAAIAISAAFGAATVIGQVSGGFIVDRLARRNTAWIVWFPGWCTIVAGIAMIGSAFAPQAWLAIVLLACWALPNGCLNGPVMGTLQSLVAPRMRGVTNSCMGLLVNLIGAGLGPLAVGLLSDALVPWVDVSIVWALALIAVIQFWTTTHFFSAGRTLKTDMARAENAITVAENVVESGPTKIIASQ